MCLGIPGQIVDVIDRDAHRAVIEVDGVRREVNIGLVVDDTGAGIDEGDWVLIHVGFAMARIDEEEAARTLDLVRLMEGYDDDLGQLSDRAI